MSQTKSTDGVELGIAKFSLPRDLNRDRRWAWLIFFGKEPLGQTAGIGFLVPFILWRHVGDLFFGATAKIRVHGSSGFVSHVAECTAGL